MECPLCFERYSSEAEELAPMRLACCRLVLCRGCLRKTIATTSRCPWERKIRWISRSFYKKCEDSTPSNFLEKLLHRHESDGEEEFIASQTKNVLGDGELSREYARVVEQRRVISEEMHADSIQKDVQYAAELLAAEQAALAKQLEEQHEIARRDAEFAQRISASQETEPLSSSTNKRHREALSEDAPTEIQPPKKKSGSGPASVGISAWLSRSSSTGPVVGSSGGRVVNMSPSEGPFAYAPSLKRKIDAKEVIEIDSDSPMLPTKKVSVSDISGLIKCASSWQCKLCTFENHADIVECEICEAMR